MAKETSGALSELALFAGAGGGILGGKQRKSNHRMVRCQLQQLNYHFFIRNKSTFESCVVHRKMSLWLVDDNKSELLKRKLGREVKCGDLLNH